LLLLDILWIFTLEDAQVFDNIWNEMFEESNKLYQSDDVATYKLTKIAVCGDFSPYLSIRMPRLLLHGKLLERSAKLLLEL